jgi:hypothetical protein
LSNWITAKRLVQERLHRFGTSDPDVISRALAEAINFYSAKRFWFNTGNATMSTVDGTYAYDQETSDGAGDGYPTDMEKIVKLSMQINSTWYALEQMSIDEFREIFLASSYKGFPSHFVWFGKQLLLFPTPNGVYSINFDYIKDLGTPVASWDGNAWTFSVDGVTVNDAYTSDWFSEAMDLITDRAVYYVASQHIGNMELASVAMQLAKEHEKELMIDGEAADISPMPVGWQ